MGLEYIKTPAKFMKRVEGLSFKEKYLLCAAASFDKGLKVSNEELAKILNVKPPRISELFSSLESKGYIKIENRMSKYRTIYFRPNAKVEQYLLSVFDESTFVKIRNYFRENTKHKVSKRNNRNENHNLPSAKPKEREETQYQSQGQGQTYQETRPATEADLGRLEKLGVFESVRQRATKQTD